MSSSLPSVSIDDFSALIAELTLTNAATVPNAAEAILLNEPLMARSALSTAPCAFLANLSASWLDLSKPFVNSA